MTAAGRVTRSEILRFPVIPSLTSASARPRARKFLHVLAMYVLFLTSIPVIVGDDCPCGILLVFITREL